jgi:glycosyltransferase involved in cell wall biosynthesis
MRIAFDVSALTTPHSGVATYTRNLADHLRSCHQDEILPMAHTSVLPRALNKTVWMQAVLPIQLSRVAPDVCHFTNSVASWWTPCPSVVTIHDTTLWLLPRFHPRRRLLAMRPFIPAGARHARAIIAVSAATKRDVVRTLKVPEAKVHVVYEAAAPQFRPLQHSTAVEAVRRKYGLPESFVLYVGTIEPRKNLIRLFEAFQIVRRRGCRSSVLALVGNRGWNDDGILASIDRLGLKDAVRFLGHAPTDDVVALYNLAELLVMPSLYEGFGLPVIEAMACGTPVVTSPNGSLAEIAGDAAEYVDPWQVESIATGVHTVLTNQDRNVALRAAGLERAAQFSWRATAEQTRRVYSAVTRGSTTVGAAPSPLNSCPPVERPLMRS